MDTTELQKKLRVFLDPIGRVLLGEVIEERCTESTVVVKNPVIIHVEALDGKISIQFFPVMFKEFLGSRDEGAIFTFNNENITLMDNHVFDIQLYGQYAQMFASEDAPNVARAPEANQGTKGEPEIIKLFPDDD